ncbi:MAG: prepilin peptidase [Candidatus Saccharimonadales bacterium]
MAYLILIGLGLCLGSFVNALVWRLHEQSSKKSKTKVDLSILKGRSVCVHCHNKLSANDLIPVVSWLSLGGKCRYCHKKISWQYPAIELLTAVLFVVAQFYWPSTNLRYPVIEFVLFGIFLLGVVIGLALSVYDFKWRLLPNKLLVPLGCLGAVYTVMTVLMSGNVPSAVLDAALAVVLSGGLFWVLYQISGGKWIGGGDVKLGFVLGLFLLTPINSFLMIFLASVLGSLYALFLQITGKYKKQMHIPFGPFLLTAVYILVLFGDSLLSGYQRLIGL